MMVTVNGCYAGGGGCGCTKAPYDGMLLNFEGSWKERLIMKINRLALFAASVH